MDEASVDRSEKLLDVRDQGVGGRRLSRTRPERLDDRERDVTPKRSALDVMGRVVVPVPGVTGPSIPGLARLATPLPSTITRASARIESTAASW